MWVQRLIEGVAHFSFIFGLAPRVAFDRVLKYDVLGKIKSHTQKKKKVDRKLWAGYFWEHLLKTDPFLIKLKIKLHFIFIIKIPLTELLLVSHVS